VNETTSKKLRLIGRQVVAAIAGLALTLAVFLVLPLMQTISSRVQDDLLVSRVDSAPPPPPEILDEPEEPEPEEPPEPPPRLEASVEPIELAQLELALAPSFGDGVFGQLRVDVLSQLTAGGGAEDLDRVFSLADLDQRPQTVFQPPPTYPRDLRAAGRRGTVYVVFTVDPQGRVLDPAIQRSTDPAFDDAALDAVKRWRFEPGTRKGKKVPFRMRVPITFNAS
jgi:protein TonB